MRLDKYISRSRVLDLGSADMEGALVELLNLTVERFPDLNKDALLKGLTLQRLAGEDYVAQNAGDRGEGLDLREAQHIGRLVDTAPFLVELALLGIVDQDDREFRHPGDLCAGLLQRLEHGPVGKRLQPVRPALAVHGKENRQWRPDGTQRRASPAARAASRRSASCS